ncbi:MAG: quinol:cytochrome C oxidoreductase [Flavobacteriaceae bacterium CG2_30_34_30]|nr:quinol:cytochrome C oxidoreductase [Flavobacteriia bacterium]OIP49734.1 MAG: quinol:cytochrome C oxidoreductase [Flavobacteriaceae bacterium CG2_30_34_30]PIQ19280.1 MAG: quinol:cytochrome C oxidoreductase [Flavobacteriaceae bacterium CG18_big_fil_WC_8_21_14_2_50_34_36]PIV48524.1 MAG: quinol:cytochrome C oxidoreductase [Flavobacteriaceae bacterium CG02_land_8_20_14_3_00_34_13]PIZ07114.1 MAG: quinol:cytochrome C oxidoreductase [Flavobacteriaceae bacterium CG_4_10_14_0_8_um_filter_34_31]PJC079
MYTLPNKLKLFAFIFMVLGAIGMIIGFMNAPSSKEEVKEKLANHNSHEIVSPNDSNSEVAAHEEDAHYEHIMHQMQNRPWSALYVSAFFFFMIALGALAFYAIQYAAQAGWSPVLFRVMEGITGYLLPGSLIMFLLLVLSAFHVNHIFHWMNAELFDPSSDKYDALIAGKSTWLNETTFLIRAAIYLTGWNVYRYFSRKYSLKLDETNDAHWFKKNFKLSAGFLVFFIVTESMMSWDWIMGFDPHWFSTLFGWYVFSGMIVCAITVIAMVTVYLKSQGYLEYVNDSHIHDLAKYMFGFSIFWTYLWFSQFMLIWYANIPEEVTYFVTRIEDYNLPFFGMVAMNFVFPILLLMNSDFKRVNWFVILSGIVILAGHYMDIFVMVMPATVGKSWFIGIPEIGALLFFFGLFVYVVFSTLTKAPLIAKGSPFIEESKHFHY